MGNKALLTWNIRPGREREHFPRVREFVHKLSSLGLELEDAWYTVYGESPQILMGIVAEGRQEEQLDSALHSKEWQQLMEELQQYVVDFNQRIVDAAVSFQF
jgi:hypothetical protein